MVAERTTDAIAHFIGFFEIKVEELRLRDSYDLFKALRAETDLGPIETRDADIESDFDLRQGKDKPLPPIAPNTTPVVDRAIAELPPLKASDGPAGPINALPLEPEYPIAFPLFSPEWQWPVPPPTLPGSIVTVTFQTAWLSDNDILGIGTFLDPAIHFADLAQLSAVVQALHAPWGFGPAELPDIVSAAELIEAAKAFSIPEPLGFDVYTVRDEDTPGKILNGAEAEFIPSWTDLLPIHHKADKHENENDIGVEDWALPAEYTANPEMPVGHSLISGGNLLVNEAHFSIALVDAPVIAVKGAWMDFDLVSQVAAITNRDTGQGTHSAPSSVYQTVTIEAQSNAAAWQEGRDSSGPAPMTLRLDVITGDLFISNYIEQLIEMMDNDMFGMSVSAANSAYILGGNTIFNVTGLVTAGFAYDLILVGGNYLTIDTIHQTLVLLDDDRVDATLASTPAGDNQTASAEGVLLAGHAKAGIAEHGIGGGDAGTIDRADGLDTAADLDDTAKPEHDQAPDWDPAPDNLLLNEAKLTTFGVDLRAEISDSLAGILADTDADLETLKERLMNDPALAGLDQARVLKVDGDLIQSNTIKQTILASDRDDIRVDGGLPLGAEILTGTNALLNAASITARGVDSTVMAQAGGYSDLLIHQARLIDEPTLSESEGLDLVNEAVAFLMEDTQAAASAKTADKLTSNDNLSVDTYDLMGSVLG